MPIKNNEKWDEYVGLNDDPYGRACVEVARKTMELLDKIDETVGFNANDVILQADRELGEGITGFMAGAVAVMVSSCHSRGEEFRASWNKDIGKTTGQEESEGVLNPALLTVECKGDEDVG